VLQRLRKIIKKPNSVIKTTAKLHKESDDKEIPVKMTAYEPPHLVVSTAQSIGLERDHNEDTIFAINATLADGDAYKNFGLFIVADGMGGHQHGEIASGMAVRVLANYFLNNLFSPLLGINQDPGFDSLHDLAEKGVYEAQAAVIQKAPGGGTTLTAALVIGTQVTIVHVGDSRCFFIHSDGTIESMTQDHSLVQRLVELGELSLEEAAVYPQKNVLYRALGQTEPFRPDIATHPLPLPGYILLCSDGLWGVVNNQEISRIVMGTDDPSAACNQLVEAANLAGGPDNISAILIKSVS